MSDVPNTPMPILRVQGFFDVYDSQGNLKYKDVPFGGERPLSPKEVEQNTLLPEGER